MDRCVYYDQSGENLLLGHLPAGDGPRLGALHLGVKLLVPHVARQGRADPPVSKIEIETGKMHLNPEKQRPIQPSLWR